LKVYFSFVLPLALSTIIDLHIKDIIRSKHKSRQKTKAKCSSRKREHSLNDKSEKRSVLGK
jgi:hypothetical protein